MARRWPGGGPAALDFAVWAASIGRAFAALPLQIQHPKQLCRLLFVVGPVLARAVLWLPLVQLLLWFAVVALLPAPVLLLLWLLLMLLMRRLAQQLQQRRRRAAAARRQTS